MSTNQDNFGIGEGTIGGPNIRAVILESNRILLSKFDKNDYWLTPGGGPVFFETTKDAIKRHIKEKCGFEIEVERLLWSIENFFVYRGNDPSYGIKYGTRIHGIGFYYLVHPKEPEGRWQQGAFRALHRPDVEFRWFKLDEIESVNLKPACLKPRLSPLPSHPEHLVCHAD